jgi:hypothetical protein
VASRKKKAVEQEKKADPTGEAETNPEGLPGEAVPHVWDHPEAGEDPPSQRPEDTHEEARRQRRAG